LVAVLDETGDRVDARGPRELLELCELVVGIDALREDGDGEPALAREARGLIGLLRRHVQSL